MLRVTLAILAAVSLNASMELGHQLIPIEQRSFGWNAPPPDNFNRDLPSGPLNRQRGSVVSAGIQFQIQKLLRENSALRQKLERSCRQSEQETGSAALRSKIDALEAENSRLRKSLYSADDKKRQIEKLEDDNRSLKEENSKLEADKGDLTGKNNALKKENDLLEFRISEFEAIAAEKEDKIDRLNEKLTQLSQQNSDLIAGKGRLGPGLEKPRTRVRKGRKRRNLCKRRNSRLIRQLNEARSQINELEAELDAKTRNINRPNLQTAGLNDKRYGSQPEGEEPNQKGYKGYRGKNLEHYIDYRPQTANANDIDIAKLMEKYGVGSDDKEASRAWSDSWDRNNRRETNRRGILIGSAFN